MPSSNKINPEVISNISVSVYSGIVCISANAKFLFFYFIKDFYEHQLRQTSPHNLFVHVWVDELKDRPHLFPAVHTLYPAFLWIKYILWECPVVVTECCADIQFVTAMLLWKELQHFHYWGMPVGDLVNHFLLLSVTGSGWPLRCRHSMADFQFSCVCVCGFIFCNG